MLRNLIFNRVVLLIIGIILPFLSFETVSAQTGIAHPRIIVTQAEFDELRQKANTEPWASMKTRAIQKANTERYAPGNASDRDRTQILGQLVGHISLAYIVDSPTNQSKHARKLYTELRTGLNDLISRRSSNSWTYNVAYGEAAFHGLIALDVVYNHLTPSQRTELEGLLFNIIDFHRDGYELSLYALKGVKEIYTGGGNLQQWRNLYLAQLNSNLTNDGVYSEGTGYVSVRLGGPEREHKSLFMDVLEYHGYNDFYSNPRIQNAYKWLYGYTYGTNNLRHTFGDTSPGRVLRESTIQIHRAGRFGDEVYRLASRAGNTPPPPTLLAFILIDRPLNRSQYTPATSTVFRDGGAWLLDRPNITNPQNMLNAALWNVSIDSGHNRYETNSISLTGYGEVLLGNAGYYGWRSGAKGFSWQYIHQNSLSNNIGLIDYNPLANDGRSRDFIDDYGTVSLQSPSNRNAHATKRGSGVVNGLLTDNLDYVIASSGNALPNGMHLRGLTYVHPQHGANGYWILFDEFFADNGGATVHTVLHPYTENIQTVRGGQHYRAVIHEKELNGNPSPDLRLDIFYGTPVNKVDIFPGLAEVGPKDLNAKYLFSTYNSDGSGYKNIVTVLFPHDAQHAVGQMQRVAADNVSGAIIRQGGVTDVALGSSGTELITDEDNGIKFQGVTVFYRMVDGNLANMLIRGKRFSYRGVSISVPANASSDFAAQYQNGVWRVGLLEETDLTFTLVGVRGAQVNGDAANVVSDSGEQITIRLSAGYHDITLASSGVCESCDINGDGVVAPTDLLYVTNRLGQTVEEADQAADVTGDNLIDQDDLAFVTAAMGTEIP